MTRLSRSYWTIWAATLLFFGSFYTLLVPLPRYLAAVGLTDWQIGFIFGTFGVASLVGRPLAGVAVDRLGMRPILLVGAGALLVGALGVITTTSMAALLVLRLLQTIGYVAFTTAGTALVVSLTPPALRSQRLAVFGIAANVAITLTPAVISVLLTVLPLESGFVLAAGLALAAGILSTGVASGAPAPHTPAGHATVWAPRVLWLPMLITALFGAGFAAFFQFAPILAVWRGDMAVGWLYTIYGVSIIATRLGGGRVLNRLSTAPVLGCAAISMSIGLGTLALMPPAGGVAVAVVLIALGSGVFHPTLIAHHAALMPQQPGQTTAAFYVGFDLGIGLGSWLFGGVLEVAGLPQLYAVAALVVVLVLPLTSLLKHQPNSMAGP